MRKKLILDSDHLDITLSRLSHQLIENHNDFASTVMVGMQPRGIFLAEMIHKKVEAVIQKPVHFGYIDATLYRDDFRRREAPPIPRETNIPFIIEEKNVILIDDVLYTGRTVRAALDAMIQFGRPSKVELLVLVDRKHTRDLPISADYVGIYVDTLETQKVLVELVEQGHKQNKIWLINKEEVK